MWAILADLLIGIVGQGGTGCTTKNPPIPCRTGGPLMNRASSGRLVREYYDTRNRIVRPIRLSNQKNSVWIIPSFCP